MTPGTYLRICGKLGKRGASPRIVASLKEAGDKDLLRAFWFLSDAQLRTISRLLDERDDTTTPTDTGGRK